MTELKTITDSDTELKVSVVVPRDEYDRQFNAELSLMAKTAKLDGFRPGKVPLNVIKRSMMLNAIKKVSVI